MSLSCKRCGRKKPKTPRLTLCERCLCARAQRFREKHGMTYRQWTKIDVEAMHRAKREKAARRRQELEAALTAADAELRQQREAARRTLWARTA